MSTQKYNKLAGKHVLVIGGTSGIGFAVAEASIESNASITISSSNQDRITKSIEKLKTSYPSAKVDSYPCDLSGSDVETQIENLFQKTGKVDHIVFTAGDSLSIIPLSQSTYETIHSAGQIRFVAALLVAKVGSKYLNPGPTSSIVLTTGTAADKPMANWSVVCSYAAGLHGMTRALALDLKPIRVNCVSPGAIDTELWKMMPEKHKEAMFKEISSSVPTGHVGRPDEVAESYLWLMKDSNVTGFIASSNSGSLLV